MGLKEFICHYGKLTKFLYKYSVKMRFNCREFNNREDQEESTPVDKYQFDLTTKGFDDTINFSEREQRK